MVVLLFLDDELLLQRNQYFLLSNVMLVCFLVLLYVV
nr:MAG TPA: hypothetical protein [Caudoviricetes sp.]